MWTPHSQRCQHVSAPIGVESARRSTPYGLIYGNRAFLVARNDWNDEPRLWRLTCMGDARLLDDRFERDPAFDLQRYARRSFGTFQEKPVRVVLRFDGTAATDAASFLFHPDQTVHEQDAGTVTVCFQAGGLDEISWHLVTWAETVTVERPVRLRRHLANMCATLAAHHRDA